MYSAAFPIGISKLLDDRPIERVRPAATKRNREKEGAPDEGRLHASPALRQKNAEGDARHFNCQGGSEETCEQAKDHAGCADSLQKYGGVGEEQAWHKPCFGHSHGDGSGTIVKFWPRMNEQRRRGDNAEHWIPKAGNRLIKISQPRDE